MINILLAYQEQQPSATAKLIANDVAAKCNAGLLTAKIVESKLLKSSHHLEIADGRGHIVGYEYHHTSTENIVEANDLASFLIMNEVEMVIADDSLAITPKALYYGRCPVMQVPCGYHFHGFRRVNYVTDLRFCRTDIVTVLGSLAKSYQADLTISHISIDGIPHMSDDYAKAFFIERIINQIKHQVVQFDHILERDVARVLDVLIHAMGTDLVVFANHHSHLKELCPNGNVNNIAQTLGIPAIIFPG